MNERKFNFKKAFKSLRKAFLNSKTKEAAEEIRKQMSDIEHRKALNMSNDVIAFGEWYNASHLRHKRQIQAKHRAKYYA